MTTPDTRIPDGDQIPQPPARRPLWRRRWARVTGVILTGLIGLIVVSSALSHPSTAAAKPASPPASSAPAAPAPASSPAAPAAPAAPTAPATGKLGDTAVVTDSSGDKYSVQLLRVTDPAAGADQYSQPDNGKHFTGVTFKVTVLSGKLDDSADNCVTSIGTDNQGYTTSVQNLAVGTDFSNGQIKLAAGESMTGTVNIAVPNGVHLTTVKWTPDSGFAGSTATWTVTAAAQAAAAPAAQAAPAGNAYAVVDQFYSDINSHDYAAAWNLGGKNIAAGQSYDSWVRGYATTVSVSPSYNESDGSGEVYLNLAAVQSDGTTRTYAGTYTVSGGVIVGANITQQS
jgi:hypothetical protein